MQASRLLAATKSGWSDNGRLSRPDISSPQVSGNSGSFNAGQLLGTSASSGSFRPSAAPEPVESLILRSRSKVGNTRRDLAPSSSQQGKGKTSLFLESSTGDKPGSDFLNHEGRSMLLGLSSSSSGEKARSFSPLQANSSSLEQLRSFARSISATSSKPADAQLAPQSSFWPDGYAFQPVKSRLAVEPTPVTKVSRALSAVQIAGSQEPTTFLTKSIFGPTTSSAKSTISPTTSPAKSVFEPTTPPAKHVVTPTTPLAKTGAESRTPRRNQELESGASPRIVGQSRAQLDDFYEDVDWLRTLIREESVFSSTAFRSLQAVIVQQGRQIRGLSERVADLQGRYEESQHLLANERREKARLTRQLGILRKLRFSEKLQMEDDLRLAERRLEREFEESMKDRFIREKIGRESEFQLRVYPGELPQRVQVLTPTTSLPHSSPAGDTFTNSDDVTYHGVTIPVAQEEAVKRSVSSTLPQNKTGLPIPMPEVLSSQFMLQKREEIKLLEQPILSVESSVAKCDGSTPTFPSSGSPDFSQAGSQT